MKYSILNTDAISCSLVHPCPPDYYCSIVLGETGVCHEEDESINEVFSGSGEKEHMEDDVKREVDNSEMYGEEEEYFDEQDGEAYMEKVEDGNSYVLPDEDEEEYTYEQDEIDYDFDDYQEEEDEFSEYVDEDEDEEDEDEEYDYTEVDDEDDLEDGNDEDEYEEDYEQDETDDDFDDYQDEDDNYEQEEDVYEYDDDEKDYRRKRSSPRGSKS